MSCSAGGGPSNRPFSRRALEDEDDELEDDDELDDALWDGGASAAACAA
ncbi:MAG: hypothetical protein IT385_04665 [Deltaproteobacteria bacterium]|nr:hypothetical protein [Deltaproteobacteria bacterium]